MKRVAAVVGILLLVIVITLVVVARSRYGGGKPYPDVTTEPVLSAQDLETVVTSEEPIGNLAVSSTGRLFYTIHPESRPEGAKLLEWVDGKAVPWPDVATQAQFVTPLGLYIDGQDRLWVIDPGNHAAEGARILAFDINEAGRKHVEYTFDKKVAPPGSFLQDMAVTSDGSYVIIADVSFWKQSPGIVVFDVANEKAWRDLNEHPSVMPQKWIIRNPIKTMKFFGVLSFLVGIDGIAIDPNDEWIYFGAMTHDTLYRVPLTALIEQRGADALEDLGTKPLNDGMCTDVEGNIYITDVEHGGVMRWRADDQALDTVILSEQIRWADAVKVGPENHLYIADSAIPHQVLQSKEHIASQAPYYIFRVRL